MINLKWLTLFILSLSFFLPLSNQASAQVCPAEGEVIAGTLDPVFSTGQPVRLFRDGVPSECEPPKAFPGTLGTSGVFNTHTFGIILQDSCITVNFDVGTCGTNVFAGAFLNEYNPANQSQNYLGDLGSSLTGSFSFVVPAGNRLVIVAESVFEPATCDYSFTIDPFPCGLPTIPTLNETGLIILGALMLLTVVIVLRKRARASA